ncbi:hypothetical protein Pan216_14470 [Planctomycetes bacterium Pan216]|uniref:DUF4174 domain-containing protein n=1 Tax=Kolteria novifilia TaxID=2527975 RepID=A0A518B0W1_9BACT|nr:hypothetical protein Pan216_14470 [Planctomycetes bacterium Pan216]
MRFSLFAVALAMLMPAVSNAGKWHSDYRKALKEAKKLDRPILVCFAGKEGPILTSARLMKHKPLMDKFVLLHVFKQKGHSKTEGQELYNLFEIDNDHAYVVIERDQEWQYFRHEEDLSDDQLGQVLEKTSDAKGVPSNEIIRLVNGEEVIESSPTQSYYYEPSNSRGYCPNCQRR